MPEVIRVSIGSEPMQYIPTQVLKSSIVRRTKSLVEFTTSWEPNHGWHPLIKSLPRLKSGTAFNTWRWCVPGVYGYRGKSIYLDSDQIVLADIAELWEALPAGKMMGCVKNAVGVFGKKKVPQPGKNQTSVMVIDNTLAMWNSKWLATEVNEGRLEYADMMQAAWLTPDEVHELDPAWNHFGIRNESTKLLHYSHVKSQPFRDPRHGESQVWGEELRAAIASGFVTIEGLRAEVGKGHLHKDWYL